MKRSGIVTGAGQKKRGRFGLPAEGKQTCVQQEQAAGVQQLRESEGQASVSRWVIAF